MAEYIDRKKYMKDKYNCDLIQIDNVELVPLYQIIDRLEQSIERSEYEKLRLVNLDLAETNKGLLAEHEQLLKLRSKIDKVIEEIKEESYLSYDDNPRRILDEECVLEILKRNIGE